jgi:hypothetical protein
MGSFTAKGDVELTPAISSVLTRTITNTALGEFNSDPEFVTQHRLSNGRYFAIPGTEAIYGINNLGQMVGFATAPYFNGVSVDLVPEPSITSLFLLALLPITGNVWRADALKSTAARLRGCRSQADYQKS